MGEFEIFDHTADVGLRVRGATLAEVFEAAGRGLFELAVDPSGVRPEQSKDLTVEAAAPDLLLREWLAELLYLFSLEGFVPCGFSILEATETRIRARLSGEPFDPARHPLKTDLKAVTYHGLSLRREGKGWQGRVVIDV